MSSFINSDHSGTALITLSQLTKRYRIGSLESTVLKSVSLTVDDGEMLAIVGASGSGKSTLMNIIGLLDKADEGRYCLRDCSVTGLNDDERARLRNQYIGFIFQQFNLLPRFTALQNVALPLTYRDLLPAQIKQQALLALEQVGMATYSEHCPTQLSGGQQQRVAIARALVGEPHVILADEPTGALDSVTGREIMVLFASLHAAGRTLILVTHDEQVAERCARRITLADGEIIAEIHQ
jgi:putative ABC transport system ATP-binding protein